MADGICIYCDFVWTVSKEATTNLCFVEERERERGGGNKADRTLLDTDIDTDNDYN